jgi:hypothetical protein
MTALMSLASVGMPRYGAAGIAGEKARGCGLSPVGEENGAYDARKPLPGAPLYTMHRVNRFARMSCRAAG